MNDTLDENGLVSFGYNNKMILNYPMKSTSVSSQKKHFETLKAVQA